jgi:hypothetical protein
MIKKREKKRNTKTETKAAKKREKVEDIFGVDEMTEGATNSDIDMEEDDLLKSPCQKCKPSLSRVTTTSTLNDHNDQFSSKPLLKSLYSP